MTLDSTIPAGGGCGRVLVADLVGKVGGYVLPWVVVVLLWVSPGWVGWWGVIWFWLALLALGLCWWVL